MNMNKQLKGKIEKFLLNFIISATIMLVGLWYTTGIAHELGHGVVCVATGGTFPWQPIFTNLVLICDPFPEHVKEISWAMGGSFGVIASIAPIFVFNFVRKHNRIVNAFLVCAFMQAGYAIFESTQNALYRINDLSANLPIALMGVLAIIFFTWSIDPIRERCTRKNP